MAKKQESDSKHRTRVIVWRSDNHKHGKQPILKTRSHLANC